MSLDFTPVHLEDRETLEYYLIPFGGNSCQHSFVSMYSLQEKYGDSFCVADGFLYLLRANRCTEDFRVYLAPMGDGDRKTAYVRLLDDAHDHGVRLRMETVTESEAEFLEAQFPGRFEIREERDYFEYIYLSERMVALPGHDLRYKRHELREYEREFGERTQVTRLTPADFPEVLAFARKWLEQNAKTQELEPLEQEYRCILRHFDAFETLRICGIVVRIDGEVHGFSYGERMNDECYHALIEKGDRETPNIYRVLFRESVRQCGEGCLYVNREEDVGSPGLRESKMSYVPDILLKKYLVTEK